jgi:hypothetical protein
MAVRLIEAVGADQYVHVQADENQVLISRRPASERWQLKEPVRVSFRTGKVHVFHQEHEAHLITI